MAQMQSSKWELLCECFGCEVCDGGEHQLVARWGGGAVHQARGETVQKQLGLSILFYFFSQKDVGENLQTHAGGTEEHLPAQAIARWG